MKLASIIQLPPILLENITNYTAYIYSLMRQTPNKSLKAEKDFPISTKYWKYHPNPMNTKPLHVIIISLPNPVDRGAFFPDNRTLIIQFSYDDLINPHSLHEVINTIRHELTHFSQFLLAEIKNIPLAGLPKSKIRSTNPSYPPTGLYESQDIEYKPLLDSFITDVVSFLPSVPKHFRIPLLKKLIREDGQWLLPLKKQSKPKYYQALKEIYKHIESYL